MADAIAMPTAIPTVETTVRPGFLIRSRRLSLTSGQEMKDDARPVRRSFSEGGCDVLATAPDGVSQSPGKCTKDLCHVPREDGESTAATREPGAAFFLEVAQQRHTFVAGTADAEEKGKGVSHVKIRSLKFEVRS